MAKVHVVSIGIVDFTGKRKTLPIFFPATTSVATIQTAMDTYLAALDAAIDGKIDGMGIQLEMTLPSGLKSTPVNGNTVREGANLRYSVANSNYVETPFVPSWANNGFAGNEVLTSTIYGDAETGLYGAGATDSNANALVAFLSGNRAFRK